MPKPTQLNPHQHRAARRMIEATIRNAYHEADLVTALLKDRGDKPTKQSH